MNNLVRFCQKCNKQIYYKTEKSYKIASSKNRNCRSCSNIGKHNFSDEEKRNISNKLIGRIISDETREKISNSLKGRIMSDEYKEKMSLICKIKQPRGEKSINFGKRASDETKEKMSISRIGKKVSEETRMKISDGNRGKIRSNEYKEKMSIIKTGKNHTNESKLKMRLSRIEEIKSKNGQVIPNYNKKACEYFNELMEQNNIKIMHAENGGEFYIKKLGYWADGYDKENNIVYEWDEKHHFNGDGTLREKDIIRENEIRNYLKCKIIRIKNNNLI